MPGMVLSAKAMLDVYPVPSEDQVREHMDGNLCRCTGYQKVYQALDKVIEQNREATDNTAQG
jgi:carbon-monoxide dehydrogenase small subunit